MKRGLVVSDLHLFARRSEGERLLGGLAEELAETEVLVLNGDTFDFRWSQMGSEEATISAAVRWLEELTERFEGRTVHYVVGNHDCLAAFREPLAELARRRPQLRTHEYRLRLGRTLFLHGDCANGRMDGAALECYRQGWSRDRPRGRASAALYGVADELGLSREFHRWYFPQATAVRRVAHHLDVVMPEWRAEVDDCFFGHTHRPFRDHEWETVRFHNTGSGIRGMGFQPLGFVAGEERG